MVSYPTGHLPTVTGIACLWYYCGRDVNINVRYRVRNVEIGGQECEDISEATALPA